MWQRKENQESHWAERCTVPSGTLRLPQPKGYMVRDCQSDKEASQGGLFSGHFSPPKNIIRGQGRSCCRQGKKGFITYTLMRQKETKLEKILESWSGKSFLSARAVASTGRIISWKLKSHLDKKQAIPKEHKLYGLGGLSRILANIDSFFFLFLARARSKPKLREPSIQT